MSTTTRNPLRAITEQQWQAIVLDGFALHGWRVWHDTVAYRSDPGWPDLVAVHPAQRRVVFVELKTERGRLTDAQLQWADNLRAAGQEWFLWRPSDWPAARRVMRGERL